MEEERGEEEGIEMTKFVDKNSTRRDEREEVRIRERRRRMN